MVRGREVRTVTYLSHHLIRVIYVVRVLSGRYFCDYGGRVPVRWSIVQVASCNPLLGDNGPENPYLDEGDEQI